MGAKNRGKYPARKDEGETKMNNLERARSYRDTGILPFAGQMLLLQGALALQL